MHPTCRHPFKQKNLDAERYEICSRYLEWSQFRGWNFIEPGYRTIEPVVPIDFAYGGRSNKKRKRTEIKSILSETRNLPEVSLHPEVKRRLEEKEEDEQERILINNNKSFYSIV